MELSADLVTPDRNSLQTRSEDEAIAVVPRTTS